MTTVTQQKNDAVNAQGKKQEQDGIQSNDAEKAVTSQAKTREEVLSELDPTLKDFTSPLSDKQAIVPTTRTIEEKQKALKSAFYFINALPLALQEKLLESLEIKSEKFSEIFEKLVTKKNKEAEEELIKALNLNEGVGRNKFVQSFFKKHEEKFSFIVKWKSERIGSELILGHAQDVINNLYQIAKDEFLEGKPITLKAADISSYVKSFKRGDAHESLVENQIDGNINLVIDEQLKSLKSAFNFLNLLTVSEQRQFIASLELQIDLFLNVVDELISKKMEIEAVAFANAQTKMFAFDKKQSAQSYFKKHEVNFRFINDWNNRGINRDIILRRAQEIIKKHFDTSKADFVENKLIVLDSGDIAQYIKSNKKVSNRSDSNASSAVAQSVKKKALVKQSKPASN